MTERKRHPSRFLEGSDAFPLRQSLRCRDEFIQRIVLTVIYTVFSLLLISFGRTVHRLFERHGARLGAWIEVAVLAVVALTLALTVRRLVRNVREVIELRREWRRWREAVKSQRNPG